MSIRSLRWRVASALITVGTAAAAVLALAVPAGAVTGTRWTSPEMAGYVATGAQFRDISAGFYLRNPAQYRGMVARFGHGVQLRSPDLVVSVGLSASTSGTSYTFHATIYDRSTHRVIASNPNPKHYFGLPDTIHPGLGPPLPYRKYGVLKVRYDPATGGLDMRASYITVGDEDFTVYCSYTVGPQSFTQARVGTEVGRSPWDASYSYTPPATPVRVATYGVLLGTYNGHSSGLRSWWVHHKLIAQPSGRDVIADPGDLYNYHGSQSFKTWLVP